MRSQRRWVVTVDADVTVRLHRDDKKNIQVVVRKDSFKYGPSDTLIWEDMSGGGSTISEYIELINEMYDVESRDWRTESIEEWE